MVLMLIIRVLRQVEQQTFGDNACHPERSEGSSSTNGEILRFAQDDNQDTTQVMSPLASRRAAHGKSYLQTSGRAALHLT